MRTTIKTASIKDQIERWTDALEAAEEVAPLSLCGVWVNGYLLGLKQALTFVERQEQGQQENEE